MRAAAPIALLLLAALAWLSGAGGIASQPPTPATKIARGGTVAQAATQPAALQPPPSEAAHAADPSQPGSTHGSASRGLVAQPGLFGTVVDDSGQAIDGITVRLLAAGARERKRQLTTTDGAGRFAFPGVHGSFECSVFSYLPIAEQVKLAEGDRHEIVLRAGEPCVLLHGMLDSGGRAVANRAVIVSGEDRMGAVDHRTSTDENGRYHDLLRPGSYELAVTGPPSAIAFSTEGHTILGESDSTPTVHQAITLTGAARRMQLDLTIPSASLLVEVCTTTAHAPVHEAFVTVSSADGGHHRWTHYTRRDGRISFAELPPGAWHVLVRSDHHLPAKRETVQIRPGQPQQQIRVELEPAGNVLVKLLDGGGEPFEPLDHDQLRLVTARGDVIHGHRSERGLWIFDGTRFVSVPVGPVELHCDDRTAARGDGMRFAPIEPIAPRTVMVRAGQTSEVSIAVQRRPRLHILVRLGGEPALASIEVHSPTGRVESLAVPNGSWHSPVPPGDYTVRVKLADFEHQERISVLAEDVEHVIQVR